MRQRTLLWMTVTETTQSPPLSTELLWNSFSLPSSLLVLITLRTQGQDKGRWPSKDSAVGTVVVVCLSLSWEGKLEPQACWASAVPWNCSLATHGAQDAPADPLLTSWAAKWSIPEPKASVYPSASTIFTSPSRNCPLHWFSKLWFKTLQAM